VGAHGPYIPKPLQGKWSIVALDFQIFAGKYPFKYTNIRAIEGVIVNGKIVK
jgi:hypothetical protein